LTDKHTHRHWHARQRLRERYGEPLTPDLAETIIRTIRRERKRHRQRRQERTRKTATYRPPEAGFKSGDGNGRTERWWVRVSDRMYEVVVDLHSWTLVTFLPAAIGGKPA